MVVVVVVEVEVAAAVELGVAAGVALGVAAGVPVALGVAKGVALSFPRRRIRSSLSPFRRQNSREKSSRPRIRTRKGTKMKNSAR